MGKRRPTFGKLQRERDKKAKAAAKRERRAVQVEETGPSESAEYAESEVLAALAAAHRSFQEGHIDADEFETRRADLSSRLRVD